MAKKGPSGNRGDGCRDEWWKELGEFFDPRRIFPFPWISWRGLKPSPAFEKQLRAITANLNL